MEKQNLISFSASQPHRGDIIILIPENFNNIIPTNPIPSPEMPGYRYPHPDAFRGSAAGRKDFPW